MLYILGIGVKIAQITLTMSSNVFFKYVLYWFVESLSAFTLEESAPEFVCKFGLSLNIKKTKVVFCHGI